MELILILIAQAKHIHIHGFLAQGETSKMTTICYHFVVQIPRNKFNPGGQDFLFDLLVLMKFIFQACSWGGLTRNLLKEFWTS